MNWKERIVIILIATIIIITAVSILITSQQIETNNIPNTNTDTNTDNINIETQTQNQNNNNNSYDTKLKQDLNKIEKINKNLESQQYTQKEKQSMIKERNNLIDTNYNYMTEKNIYNYYSEKYGLDWEC